MTKPNFGNIQVVLIDGRDYGKSMVSYLGLCFEGIKIVHQGGSFRDNAAFLSRFVPEPGVKTFYITAGTIDEGPQEPGDAYGLLIGHLKNLLENVVVKGGNSEELLREQLRSSVAVIMNPAYPERATEAFPPFKVLRETCDSLGIEYKVASKAKNGPEFISGLIEQMILGSSPASIEKAGLAGRKEAK